MDFIHILKNIAKNKAASLILIVLLGIVLRIIRAIEMNRYDVDCYIYFNMAINWANYGANYTYSNCLQTIPPLLPFLMSLGYKLGIQPEITGIFFGIMLGSLIPFCMFYIVKTLLKRADLALLAAFFGAIHPSLVRISVRCLRDSLYIPLIAIALVCAVAAIKNRSVVKWSLFSFVVTLACFARYEGYEFIIIFLIWVFVEIVIKFVGKHNHPFAITHSPATIIDIKYYSCSLFFVLAIFLSLNLFVYYSFSLCQNRYTSPFFSIVNSIIDSIFTK